jgi:hypothetical protein
MVGLIGVEDGQAPKYLKRFTAILFLATVISLTMEGGGYFIFLRWLYFTTLIYCFGLNLVLERPLMALLSIGMAILYNPFWPIWLQERGLWLGLDIATMIAIYLFAKHLKSNFFGDSSSSPQFTAKLKEIMRGIMWGAIGIIMIIGIVVLIAFIEKETSQPSVSGYSPSNAPRQTQRWESQSQPQKYRQPPNSKDIESCRIARRSIASHHSYVRNGVISGDYLRIDPNYKDWVATARWCDSQGI